MNRLVDLVLGAMILLGPVLLDSSLKGFLLLASLGLIAMALRRASAAARHLVWLIGIAGLLALPLFSFALPTWQALPVWMSAPFAAPASAPVGPGPALTGLDIKNLETSLRGPAEPSSGSKPRQQPNQAIPGGLAPWLGVGWAVGAALLFLRLGVGVGWLRIVTRRAEPVLNGPLATELTDACAALGIRQPVRLLLGQDRRVPLVWGIWRPCLILPGAARHWDHQRTRAVLLHELAHVKRLDLPALWLTQVACALYWFNPLVWLAAWRLHVERERACDDLVLNTGLQAADYAEHLVQVATTLELNGSEAALAMARPTGLESRITAILNGSLNRQGVSKALALAVLTAGLGLLIPLAMIQAADTPPAKPSSPARAADPGEPVADPAARETKPIAGEPKPAGDPFATPAPKVLTVDFMEDGALQLSGQPITREALLETLAVHRRTQPDLQVALRASSQVALSNIVQVINALRQTGFTSHSFWARPAASESSPAIANAPAEASPPRELVQAQAEAEARALAVRAAEQGRAAARQAPAGAKASPEPRGEPIDPLAEPDPWKQSKLLAEARLRLAEERYASLRGSAPSTDQDVALAELRLARAELSLATRRLEQVGSTGQPAMTTNERAAAGEELARAEALLQVATALYRKIGTAENAGRSATPPARKRTVTVLGQVNRPGPVEMGMGPDQELDLVEAIGCAQGTTRQANTRRIELTRQGKTDRFNLDELRRSANKHWLEPGDVIFVPESVF